ncbi:unnamed protein product [Mytilus coruscus]|uniref:Reverse transcriptase domain-containing protein n=1 Tax=Mytilus coruscus TaxID=42192 RepID=A0A6J8DXE3_MYTCO|nr:unnamed protein product [Mytilus coruscus]
MNYNYDHESSHACHGSKHKHANPRRKRESPFRDGPSQRGRVAGGKGMARGHGISYRGRGYRRSVFHKKINPCVMRNSPDSWNLNQDSYQLLSIIKTNIPTVILDKNFQISKIQCNLPIARRLRWFSKNWQKITGDHFILQIVQGYKQEFNTLLLQRQPPQYPMFNREQKDSLNQEIQKLLEKGAVQSVHQEQTQFLSYIFLVPKKGRGKPSSDKLEK